ncbi:MAG: molybdopterin molybdotransferase MoeA [Hyphomicrobiales bacterium]
MSLTPVETALAEILKSIRAQPSERVHLSDAAGRVLARDVRAKRNQPPFDASAMDGYAVKAVDVTKASATLKVIGKAPAGRAYKGRIKRGQAVRIFTGAPLPLGADTIVIQEDCTREGDEVTVDETTTLGKFVRKAGLDFAKGETLLTAGTKLNARHVGLAAAMNHATLPVLRKPKVALLATGDELVLPGETPRADQIVSSNNFALAAFIQKLGGEPIDLGIAPDNRRALTRAIKKAKSCEILLTLGGASVGDHDLVQEVLENEGMRLTFYRIAMRPGKPLIYGKMKGMHVLGLPGNPVSSMVCARLFLQPLLRSMLGDQEKETPIKAKLASSLPANDRRQDYLRATLIRSKTGELQVKPFSKQDSSMLATLTRADCLIIRKPHARPAKRGEMVSILPLDM